MTIPLTVFPDSRDSSVSVRIFDDGGVVLDFGDDYTLLTPAEARQIAAALNRAAALRPVPAA